jgi:E3 ubiquitin-protein ligase HUWE1
MHRMMQSSGTTEGLRGLIDSTLLKSVHKIMENRSIFGPSIVSLAINIMATFIHNEPTSLTIIQEAKLPEAFYKSLDASIEPSIEVIQAIPNALGALCLNQTGEEQLAARPTIIPGLLAIFTSEKHLKVLQDKENAVLVGTAVDELVRHHPNLKGSVFEAIKSTLSKIEEMGSEFEVPKKIKPWYRLVPEVEVEKTEPGETSRDIVMGDVPTDPSSSLDAATSGSFVVEEQGPRAHDNIIVSFIDVFGRVRLLVCECRVDPADIGFSSSSRASSSITPTAVISSPRSMVSPVLDESRRCSAFPTSLRIASHLTRSCKLFGLWQRSRRLRL